jgi:hypothetical protein
MAKRKTAAEAKVERVTWGLLVAVCAAGVLTPPDTLPNGMVPLLCGVVLLASGLYQQVQRWRVSPATWVLGTALIGIGGGGMYYSSLVRFNLTLVALLIVVAFILLGMFSNET